MKKLSLLAIFAILVQNHKSFAWGAQGHKITGDIALMVTPKAIQDSVNKYLDNMKWGDAATWMDEIRSDHKYDYMKPWHYVNVDKDKTYVKVQEPNVINEIEVAIAALKKRKALTKEEIATNIKVLFHLIGDMHQPLHVGYGDDKGGNSVEVEFLNHTRNLHQVWDSDIITEKKITTASLETLYKQLKSEEYMRLKKIEVVVWMDESRAYLPDVYGFKKGEINKEYIDKNEEIIKKQLLYGGLRIASVMNEVFSKAGT